MPDKEIFVLIDAHALIHRAYHAFPATLRTRKGEHINAVYGFTRILLEVLEKFKPRYIVCAFDSKGPTFRHKQYSEYKATRKKTDPELIEQFPRVKEVVKAFNIPIIAQDSFEADDILGTIVNDKTLESYEKIIVTGDHDILQLIDDANTKVYISGNAFAKPVLYNAEAVKGRYKFGPEYLIDYKGLRGDSSDNIPGVKGVGEKTATELILKFGHLEDIYNAINEIPSKSVKNKLESSRDMAFLSKELATINTAVDIKVTTAAAEFEDFDEQTVKDIFVEYGFASLINKIPKSKNKDSQVTNPNAHVSQAQNTKSQITNNDLYIHLKTGGEITEFLAELKKQKIFAFDTETTGLDYTNSRLLGISISWQKGKGYFIDLDSAEFDQTHLKSLRSCFENSQVKKIGHNIKFDAHMLRSKTVRGLTLGIEMQNYYFDTMIAQYLLSGSQGRHGLKSLAFTECGMQLTELSELWQEVAPKIKKNYTSQEIEQMMLAMDKTKLAKYASMDADATWRLYEILEKRMLLEENEKTKTLFFDIEMPIVPVLVDMEARGIKLDVEYLQTYGKELESRLGEVKKEIYQIVGHEFNIASSKQVGEILFDELGLAGGKKTKTGAWQTNEYILASYKAVHPIINLLLEYREISKMLSTYVSSLIDQTDRNTGRIHTSYNQTIATTGRLSSTQPNLQNIPISSEVGKKIRRAFVSEKGNKLISFDISQQELRILAHLSGEEKLIEAFKKGIDIHKNTASMLFKIPEAEITKKQRDVGKTLNYSLVYGISAYGLSDRLKISVEEAQDLIDRYFQIYPKVRTFFDELLEGAKQTERVYTMYGRYRSASDLKSSNYRIRNATEREVINFPIQGSASDLMKLAMIEVYKYLNTNNSELDDVEPRMLLQVHDELVFEVKESDKINQFCEKISEIMSSVGEMVVPMLVEHNVGENWADLK